MTVPFGLVYLGPYGLLSALNEDQTWLDVRRVAGAFKTRRNMESLFHPAIYETYFLPRLCARHCARHWQRKGESEDAGSHRSVEVRPIRNTVRGTNADHVRNLNFYSDHILKSQKKQELLSFRHVIDIKVIEIFYILFLFHTKSLRYSAHFTLSAHVCLHWPHFRCSVATFIGQCGPRLWDLHINQG